MTMIPRYQVPEIEKIWSKEEEIKRWINIELRVYEAQQKLGVIPATAEDVESLKEYINSSRGPLQEFGVFMSDVNARERETHHDMTAFLYTLEDWICHSSAKFIHYGLTSSDVKDTSFSMAIEKSCDVVYGYIAEVLDILLEYATREKYTAFLTKTHGVSAEPTTLGLIFLSFYQDLVRAWSSLSINVCRNAVYKLSGAVGNFAYFPAEVERKAIPNDTQGLGSTFEDSPSQIVSRERYAEIICSLALVASVLEKIALQIRLWHRDGDIKEGFGENQTGSSAMPHKKNPIDSEQVCGLARIVKSYVVPALDNIALWDSRDMTHSSAERIMFPDAFGLVVYMSKRLGKVLRQLSFDRNKMLANLHADLRWGSQKAMLNLLKSPSIKTRAEAHKDAARQTEALNKHRTSGILTNGSEAAFLLYLRETYFQNVDKIFERVLGKGAESENNQTTVCY